MDGAILLRVTPVRLAVNGTLMRGLALNGNLLAVGATFVRETKTAPIYRLWSIDDVHPAMLRVSSGGAAISVEVWAVPSAGLATILLQEPPGLSIGKVRLLDGEEVLGVLGEPALCADMREITAHSGWREYLAARDGGTPEGAARAGEGLRARGRRRPGGQGERPRRARRRAGASRRGPR